MKCSICSSKIEYTFLEKIFGTFIKKKPVCSNCQRKYTKEELLKKIE